MREVEVKILEINKKAVEKRLLALGAKKSFDGKMDAVTFTHPDIDMKGVLLRLREEGKNTMLVCKTGKNKSKKAKIQNEYETAVEKKAARAIIDALGFVEKKHIVKHRVQYDLGKAHIAIDTHEGKYCYIPVFLEIEAPNIKTIHVVAKKLGFTPADCKAWSFSDVVKKYS